MKIFRQIINLSILLLFVYSCKENKNELPVYNPSDFNPQLVDKSLQSKNKNHVVANFQLINQNGKTITEADYEDKIYVADFFFTRCTTICPIMTNNIAELQEYFKNDDDVMFLSMSVTPKIDSVSILRQYADAKGVIDGKWNITTGDKSIFTILPEKAILQLLNKEMVVYKILFIHLILFW